MTDLATPAPVRRSRRRTALLNLLLGVFSIGLAILFAEFAIRLLAPQQLIQIRPDLWTPTDTLGWVHLPNVDTEINTGEGSVRVLTDRDGYRVGATGRASGTPVLVLGDSFMEALQVEYEESFPGLLETRLTGSTGRPIAVRNSGVSGWSPNHYLIQARAAFAEEAYPLVLVALFVGNDVVPAAVDHMPPRAPAERFSFRFPRSIHPRELVNAILRPLNDALELRSHLFVLTKNNMKTMRMRAGLHVMAFPEEFFTRVADTPRWATTADICAHIAELAMGNGAETVFVLVPDAIQVAPDELEHYLKGYDIDPTEVDLDQPNRLLTAELRARGLRVVDPLPQFRAARAQGVLTHGHVDAHFTPAGHALMVDAVLPVATELLRDSVASHIVPFLAASR